MQPATRDLLVRKPAEMLLGPPLPRRLPDRIVEAIRAYEDRSEVLICLVQILAIAFFAVFYAITPKGFGVEARFEPVPITLAAYAGFTLLRLRLALRGRLAPAFLAASVVIDP